MSNLTIENLTGVLSVGDAGNANVLREMAKNGMEAPGASAAGDTTKTFSQMMGDAIDKVNVYQHQADTAINSLVAGRTKNIHETMLAVERADTSLKLMMQVRNKVLDACREIMRMQV